MTYLHLDTHEGQRDFWNANILDPTWNDFWQATTPVTVLSFDPAHDALIVFRGGFIPWLYTQEPPNSFTWIVQGGMGAGTFGSLSYDPDSLSPTDALRYRGFVANLEFPHHGNIHGFCRDPNTGQLYGSAYEMFRPLDQDPASYGLGDFRKSPEENGAMVVNIDVDVEEVGQLLRETVTCLGPNAATEFAVALGINVTNNTGVYVKDLHQVIHDGPPLYAAFPNIYSPVIAPNVLIFDDVAVFLFEDAYHQAFLSVVRRGAQGQPNQWLGSRRLRLGHVLQLCPIGIDRGMAICWQASGGSITLVAATFRYDRHREELVAEGIETIPASPIIREHEGIGSATYDSNRQHLILLSQDGEVFVRYTPQALCHPGRPSSAYAAVPLSAVHAGKPTTFAALTTIETNGVLQPTVYLSWGAASAGLFSTPAPTQFATDYTGTGTFGVQWTSAAEGASVTPTVWLSSYSVILSHTYTDPLAAGLAYGVDPMTVIAASNTFNVSAGLSASLSASTLTTAAVILPGRPALQSDAVGAGTPQELVFPTSALNSPVIFELNPQIVRNFASELLTRPLYASQRTLSRTATVGFAAHFTDLEIQLQWMGGGDRAAMSWAFFSQLYNYWYQGSLLDVASSGYLRWRPKDWSNHVYDILFVNLEVGQQNAIQLDSLAKAGAGWIHEAVTATFRVVNEVE